jgi:hypothetical protein
MSEKGKVKYDFNINCKIYTDDNKTKSLLKHPI